MQFSVPKGPTNQSILGFQRALGFGTTRYSNAIKMTLYCMYIIIDPLAGAGGSELIMIIRTTRISVRIPAEMQRLERGGGGGPQYFSVSSPNPRESIAGGGEIGLLQLSWSTAAGC